jgi:hypothetical protein
LIVKKFVLFGGLFLLLGSLGGCGSTPAIRASTSSPPHPGFASEATQPIMEQISLAVPYPRGMEMIDGKLYVLDRGEGPPGGTRLNIDDHGGAIYVVDPSIAEPIESPPSDRIRANGHIVIEPTDLPFSLLNRKVKNAIDDRWADRPYCTLAYDPASRNFFVCCFSGIDKPSVDGIRYFSKNVHDGILRYDLRTRKWYTVERHNMEAGGNYPQHDPYVDPPPHGWLNGPDNCLVVGRWLYAVAKDNSMLVRYDLNQIKSDPNAPAPPSFWVLGPKINVEGLGPQHFDGHSALAVRDGYLYLGYRTSNVIVRFPLDADGLPKQPIKAQLVARFKPYDPRTGKSGNLIDMSFDSKGRLYVISAMPGKIYRFAPDPKQVFDARSDEVQPWCDVAGRANAGMMEAENLFIDKNDNVYVTAGNSHGHTDGLGGAIYRIHD